ncbi:MAG: hypothetical protein RMI00_06500, partial [Sulfolobales archaeon]|nr:hypothetical protein [Sulfolobales archaeon]
GYGFCWGSSRSGLCRGAFTECWGSGTVSWWPAGGAYGRVLGPTEATGVAIHVVATLGGSHVVSWSASGHTT